MMFFFDWKEYSAQEYLDNVSLLPRWLFLISRLLLLKVNLACFFLELSQGQDDGMADSLPFTSLRAYLQH